MTRQQGCVKGNVIGGVVAVATSTFNVVNDHLWRCPLRKFSAQVDLDVRFEVVNALAVRPNFELVVVVPLRECTRWTNGCVRNVGTLVPRFDMF